MVAASAGPAVRERPARFVVLDGVDGCGKSTQAALLVEALRGRAAGGRPHPLHVREPGTTRFGERLRDLLLDPDPELSLEPGAETLLFAAVRHQLLHERVLPALGQGVDVVCERFNPSTFAYQAVAGGLDEDRVLALLAQWCPEPPGTLTLILDLPPAKALARRGEGVDRFEGRGRAFHEKVALGYRRYAERVPGARLLEADLPREELARRILAEVLG